MNRNNEISINTNGISINTNENSINTNGNSINTNGNSIKTNDKSINVNSIWNGINKKKTTQFNILNSLFYDVIINNNLFLSP